MLLPGVTRVAGQITIDAQLILKGAYHNYRMRGLEGDQFAPARIR